MAITKKPYREYKCISHADRMNNPIHTTPKLPPVSEHFTFVNEQVVDETTNRVTRKLVKKIVDTDPYKHLKVSDFSLENLQASGALSSVASCSLSHDAHTTIASLTQSAKNIVKSSKTE